MGHSVSLCKLLRVIAIEWIECDHFCIFICIEISVAIFSIKLSKILTELCPLTSDIEEERKSNLRMNNRKCTHKTYKIYVVVVVVSIWANL